LFDLAALESALAGTIYVGRLNYAPVTDSTNSDALTAARRGAPHGTVFFADEQTAGRGRGGHQWLSVAGDGLYVSVVLRLAVFSDRLLLLPLAAGLAAARAVDEGTGLTVDIRWPNDLLIGPMKVGGILVEARTESKELPHAVVGIGINVHQRTFPDDLATPATSLDLAVGRRVSRQALLVALLRAVEREASAVANPELAKAIPERIEATSSWVRGRRVEVHGPQACAGTTAGLDANGFLRVETASGLVIVQTGGIREAAFSSQPSAFSAGSE
jgi:BirA family transcriptional regulator, biotin operon repressor / biotin---[acetyl-CoA-carboxylase] ligase